MSSPARTHLGQWTDFPPLPPWIVALFSPRLAGSYPTLPPPHSLPSATALYSNPHHQETTIILYPPTIHQFCPTPSITNFVPLVLPMSSHPFAFSIVLFTPKTIPRSDLYQRRLPLPLRFQLLPPPEPPKKSPPPDHSQLPPEPPGHQPRSDHLSRLQRKDPSEVPTNQPPLPPLSKVFQLLVILILST